MSESRFKAELELNHEDGNLVASFHLKCPDDCKCDEIEPGYKDCQNVNGVLDAIEYDLDGAVLPVVIVINSGQDYWGEWDLEYTLEADKDD